MAAATSSGASGHGSGDVPSVYLLPASLTCPVTVSRTRVWSTSWRSCRSASATTIAAGVSGRLWSVGELVEAAERHEAERLAVLRRLRLDPREEASAAF